MKILGKQNTPCGHYDDKRDIECDAIVCRKISVKGGTWHLHRYLRYSRLATYKIRWSARLVPERVK